MPEIQTCKACGSNLYEGVCVWCSSPQYAELKTKVPIANRDISSMPGVEFEEFVRELLLLQGYSDVRMTSLSGDMGGDLIVTHRDRRIAVQCKRSASPVGVRAVQEVIAAQRYYGTDEAWVISNSGFTVAAKKLASVSAVRLRTLSLGDSRKS